MQGTTEPRARLRAARRRRLWSRSPVQAVAGWRARRNAHRERIDVRRGDAPFERVVRR